MKSPKGASPSVNSPTPETQEEKTASAFPMVLGKTLLQMAAAVGGSHVADMATRALQSNHKGALENKHLHSLGYRGVEHPQPGTFAVPIQDRPIHPEMIKQGGDYLIDLTKVRIAVARGDGPF